MKWNSSECNLEREQSQSRANGHPPNKWAVSERNISLESGVIISGTASMPEHVQDERLPEAKETMQPRNESDENQVIQVVTIGMLRQLLQEVLQPQTKESTPAKAKIRTEHQDPESYANVAAAPPVLTTRPRRVTKASSTSSKKERKLRSSRDSISTRPELITIT